MVYAFNKDSKVVKCRAILDTCSTANFITDKLASDLKLKKRKCFIPVSAVNELSTIAKSVVSLTIGSLYNGYKKTFSFLVIPQITNLVPNEKISRELIPIPENLPLADPTFHIPRSVDLLLSSGPSLSLFCVGQINLSRSTNDLILQKTRLGWVIGGNLSIPPPFSRHASCNFTELSSDIAKFWKLEEEYGTVHLSKEQTDFENHFQTHTYRDLSGRYVVALPFRENSNKLGESRDLALKRLSNLEKKLDKHPVLKEQYNTILQEYLDLGHMNLAKNVEKFGFYLPHFAVFKEGISTTKIRIVFDGSAKSESGLSLNDVLMTGSVIQDDVFTHMIRFRLSKFVLTGDVEKMYRQFKVRKQDTRFQRILWKRDGKNIETFELNTITFGISSSSFLAIRALHKLADDESHRYPEAAKIIKGNIYVDDMIMGIDTIEKGIERREQITLMLKLGGLNIRQWASNDVRLLEGLTNDEINLNLHFNDEKTLKTLGVFWNSQTDNIVYSVKPQNILSQISKRSILAEISRLFDPLGLLGPIILFAKVMMQNVWQAKLTWDESVPSSIHTAWLEFCGELHLLNNLKFSRKIIIDNPVIVDLHGFCDASQRGYGACIYIRSVDTDGNIQCQLLCAKSRVAPLKTITLPRLELCSALLLSTLYSITMKALNVSVNNTTFWTDSTIVLSWINTSPHTLQTFIANRVSKIQEKTCASNWKHVKSSENPADALSRGQTPTEFKTNTLWKEGPWWLSKSEDQWPPSCIQLNNPTEIKKGVCLAVIPDTEIFKQFSSYTKMKRIIAYCLRFKLNNHHKGPLLATELDTAEKTILKVVQKEAFSREINDLHKKREINRKSTILALTPFLGQDEILRVGGRLKNASIPYSQQHPVLLPRTNHVTDLIIRREHLNNLHSGILSTLYAIRRKFWIIDGRNQVRRIIRSCIPCFRINPSNSEYIMGDLPQERVTQGRPFSKVGIDYCGPFYIKEKKHRNRAKIKCYVAIFVCLTVKAVHLEVVSDMSTESFIGALRRFIARRGKPNIIRSDNGSNFVGANNQLKDLETLFKSEEFNKQTTSFVNNQGIKWKFIPPLSPHFGGIWESAVKSFKHHLQRVVKDILFTFEEINTFVIEIEAVLNSRPLTPISQDPNDLIALTPGHFLIGDSLTSIPDRDFELTPTSRLSRWQHLQKMRQDFWTRWHKEYLNHLNIRYKWKNGSHQMKEGTIVVLKEDNTPPLNWILGRITKTFPGSDGIIRTAIVKTIKGEFKRNIRKLAMLPIDDNETNRC